MRWLQLAGIAVCSFLLFGIIASPARADTWNQKTYVTLGAPVEIPGFHGPTVLSPGTYTFELLDSMSNRNIVQIFNKEQTHLYATILAIPDYRLTATGKTVIKFEERAGNAPEALRAWFYPGNSYGQEFVYPRVRALELAKANNQPVLSMPEEEAANISKPVKSANEPAVSSLEKAPVTAVKPNGEEEAMNQVVATKPTNPVAENEAKTLPKTGSEMPLVVLCGSLFVGLGIGLRKLGRAV